MKLDKSDYAGIIIAEIGAIFFCMWGVWSYGNYHIPFIDITGFLGYLWGLI